MDINIKVYGSGCLKCKTLEKRVKQVIEDMNLQSKAKIEKVTDIMQIMDAGVTSTPALEINGKFIVKGRVATEKEIQESLKNILK